MNESLASASRTLIAGGLVAYPTEAVFGFGCVPWEHEAVTRLLSIKERSWEKGLPLIAASIDQIEPLIILPKGKMREEILNSWPGPFTWILQAKTDNLPWISGGRDTFAVRITDHPIAKELCTQVGAPLVSTSANRAGKPPLRRAHEVRREFQTELDDIVDGKVGDLAEPTTIKDGRTGQTLRGS
ncbi:MAG: tRNA threonylcarbamoyladenosine biosynthesis protein RimN [Rhodospirillaceae bacterium]|nr:tRNA threonylcarbamoyladenosine biosynthesis protein RimN [Rhodospirillaceae bacterium]|tara:strand:- start:17023 stop:17577 length:555 start_codon:yes stop_codon:yes gene_type:complete